MGGTVAGAARRQRSLERRGLRRGLRVLVTGGAGGIGLVIARACHDEGARVHVADINAAALATCELPPEVRRSACDVSAAADVDRLFAAVCDDLGGLDVLVNNAAITGPVGPVEGNDADAWTQTIQVNLISQFLCIRRAVPLLREAGGGSIVNLSSVAGRLGFPERSAYAASKWGIVGLTRSVAMEVGADGIRVNSIQPGIVAGERQMRVQRARAKALGISQDEMSARYVANVSMRRKVEAEEIADTVIWLCSEAGRSVSGRSIGVCGNVETMRRG